MAVLPRSSSSLLSLLAAVVVAVALAVALPALAATRLPLRQDGTYRIVVFADMHISGLGALNLCSDIAPEERPCNEFNTTDFMERVLDVEKPDLVVFTGDNLSGAVEHVRAINQYAQVVIDRQIPWAMVFGNHDAETVFSTREDEIETVMSLPYALTERGPLNVDGVGNYYLQLVSQDNITNVANLWFLDSGAYSAKEEIGIGGYDWVRPSQIAWYSENAAALRAENGGRTAPALAFFHIPIYEYELVTDKVGDTQEAVADAVINSGLYTAFVEAGDVKATFVGHDHTNDYCGKYYGLNLCYGGGIGFTTYGRVGWDRRSRVIEFRNNGTSVTTWKRLADDDLTIKDVQTLF